jgi:hypothetical protein
VLDSTNIIFRLKTLKRGFLLKEHNKNILLYSLLFFLFFFFSYFFSGYFTGGDQVLYSNFYEKIRKYNIFNGFYIYKQLLDANEPVYYLITWFFSRFLSKNLLFSLINASGMLILYSCLKKMKINKLIICSFFLNFYLLVLLFSAERLKIALIFILLAVTVKKYKITYYLLSCLSHFQSFLIILSIIIKRLRFPSRFKISNFLTFIFNIYFISMCVIVIIGVFHEHLLWKIIVYSEMLDLQDRFISLMKPLIFMFMSFYYSSFSKKSILSHLPLLIISFFLGSSRIVIFSYMLFLSDGLKVNKGLNLGVILTSIYFSVKGCLFLIRIYLYGDGFYITIT